MLDNPLIKIIAEQSLTPYIKEKYPELTGYHFLLERRVEGGIPCWMLRITSPRGIKYQEVAPIEPLGKEGIIHQLTTMVDRLVQRVKDREINMDLKKLLEAVL